MGWRAIGWMDTFYVIGFWNILWSVWFSNTSVSAWSRKRSRDGLEVGATTCNFSGRPLVLMLWRAVIEQEFRVRNALIDKMRTCSYVHSVRAVWAAYSLIRRRTCCPYRIADLQATVFDYTQSSIIKIMNVLYARSCIALYNCFLEYHKRQV
jgi:hypothetical protein